MWDLIPLALPALLQVLCYQALLWVPLRGALGSNSEAVRECTQLLCRVISWHGAGAEWQDSMDAHELPPCDLHFPHLFHLLTRMPHPQPLPPGPTLAGSAPNISAHPGVLWQVWQKLSLLERTQVL